MRVRLGRREDTETLSALAIQVWLHTYATEGISSVIAKMWCWLVQPRNKQLQRTVMDKVLSIITGHRPAAEPGR